MYEQFRCELMAKLGDMDNDALRMVIQAVDDVASHYIFDRASTDLIVYNGGLPDVCKAYLVSRSIEGLSPKTLRLYQLTLTRFFSTMSKPLNRITTNDIRVWLYAYESSKHISKRTMELYRLIIGGFFRWASADGWLDSNPAATIKPIKYTRKPRKAMEQMELEYIREVCKTPQELAIVEMLYSTGCRISELSIIKKSDIDWDKREVTLFGKGNKYRTSYLNAKAIVAVRNYLATRKDDSEYLIVTTRVPHHPISKSGLERVIHKIAQRASAKLSVHVTPHIFRHTTATTALQHGMPVQDVQRMLGHANINTTMIYAEVQQSEVKTMHLKCVV